MKKSVYNYIGVLFLIAAPVIAQVPKKTIVEHFTNTKCGVCASRNPGFYTNLSSQSGVLHLAIHPSSPYSGCLLYQQNNTENDARTNYYGVYGGTPRLVINGSVISSSANYADNALFTPYLQQLSPASIKISQIKYGTDSIRSRIVIKTVANHTLGGLSLFVLLAEDTLNYTGSNGEPKHYDVFRKALSSTSGISVTLPSVIGDSLVFSGKATVQSFWNFSRINTMAILQETTNKALVQAAKYSTPTLSTTTGTDEFSNLPELRAYPNPGKGVFYFNSTITGQIEVRNALGQLVFAQQNWKETDSINLSGNSEGLYFLTVTDKNGLQAKSKLILTSN
jgi:Secretion system C-terminal sorting domain